jgi:hypothetical protein
MKTYSKRDNGLDMCPAAKRRRVEGGSEGFTVTANSSSIEFGAKRGVLVRKQSSIETGRDKHKSMPSETPIENSCKNNISGLSPPSSRLPLSVNHPSSGNRGGLPEENLGGKPDRVNTPTASTLPVSLRKSASVSTPNSIKCDSVKLNTDTCSSSKKISLAISKPHRSSDIKSYFKPLSRRSGSPPISSTKSLNSSDSDSVTPPSSPPPLFPDEIESFETCQKYQKRPQRRLVRKHQMRSPLDGPENRSVKTNIHNNKSPIAQLPTSTAIDELSRPVMKPNRKNSKKLQQTHLDLGQISETVCKNCEMIYNSAVESDRRDHETYCYSHRCPLLTKEEGRKKNEFAWENMIEGTYHRIRMITCASPESSKETAIKIINYVYTELPGLCYSPEELWGGSIRDQRNQENSVPVGPFKIFIYYVGTEVAGVLLAESYKEGMVVQLEGLPAGQKFVVIDRIWVREKHRREGFASLLADVVRQRFMCGIELEKSGVATSDLTRGFGVPWVRGYFGNNSTQCP